MRIRHLPTLLAGTLALAAPLSWCPAAAAQDPAARTVLAIHWGPEDFPGRPPWTPPFGKCCSRRPGPPSTTSRSTSRPTCFRRPPHRHLRDYIARKFAGRRIDAVVAVRTPALDFALEHRRALFPGAPIVFVAGRVPDAVANHQIPGVTGVLSDVVFADTLDSR